MVFSASGLARAHTGAYSCSKLRGLLPNGTAAGEVVSMYVSTLRLHGECTCRVLWKRFQWVGGWVGGCLAEACHNMAGLLCWCHLALVINSMLMMVVHLILREG